MQPIGRLMIERLLKRQGHLCGICSAWLFEGDPWHVDHIIPVARGGRHREDNLQVTHAKCNLAKGAKLRPGD